MIRLIYMFSLVFSIHALASMNVYQQPIIIGATSHQWVNSISAAGVGTTTQPAFTDISGSVAASQMPAFTGDVTTVAGAVANTLATVNSNIGSYTNASVTVNAKGLVTGASSASTTGSGNTVLATSPTLSNPVVGTQASSDNSTLAASTAYVQTALAQLNPAAAVYAASTANVAGTYTNAVSGVCIADTFQTTATTAFALDGTSPAVGARILLKNQTSTFNDGVWTLTTQAVGSVSGAILTRALDFDSASDINAGSIIPVANGTVNAGSSWYQTGTVTTCNTDAQTWTQFQAASSAYLKVANNLSDVASSSTAINNILPSQTGNSGKFLTTNGSASSWGAPSLTYSQSQVWVQNGNGYGSSSTTVRRFVTTNINTGSDITYADSATLGGTFTINTAGLYMINYSDAANNGQANIGITQNSGSLTTNIQSITYANGFRATTVTYGANYFEPVSVIIYCAVNDVIRAQTGTEANFGTDARVYFNIVRLR